MINNTVGLIYDIQRYSLHDGPGIRTIVFLKGCPLCCPWCANPESQSTQIEYMYGKTIGYSTTVQEVSDVIVRDKVFYDDSGGGLTLSGGEPLMQHEFAEQLVLEAKKKGIRTAIETTGYQKWNLLWKVIKHIDLVLLDIKVMDATDHKSLLGVSNELIIKNAKALAALKKEMVIRIPIIPDYNDSWENLFDTCQFANQIGVKQVELLPYHRLGENKYDALDREYQLKGLKSPSRDDLKTTATKLQGYFDSRITVV